MFWVSAREIANERQREATGQTEECSRVSLSHARAVPRDTVTWGEHGAGSGGDRGAFHPSIATQLWAAEGKFPLPDYREEWPCKSQGGALCFVDRTRTEVLSTLGSIGTRFTRVINMRRRSLRFSQARDLRPCCRSTQLCTAGRTGQSFSLCLSFLVMYFLKEVLSVAWT